MLITNICDRLGADAFPPPSLSLEFHLWTLRLYPVLSQESGFRKAAVAGVEAWDGLLFS